MYMYKHINTFFSTLFKVNSYKTIFLYCAFFVSDISDHIKFNNLSRPITHAQFNNHTTTFTVMLIVTSCVVMLSIMLFIVYRKVFAQYRVFIPTYNKELKPLHVKERPIVLLLYARDCPMFKKVMVKFRSVLKSSLKCQVSDFDKLLQFFC